MPPVASATMTSWPASAAVRATASPTTPAPTTRTCMLSTLFLYATGNRNGGNWHGRQATWPTSNRSALADAEGGGAFLAMLAFQHVAGLGEQGGNVDRCQRVGAGDEQNVSSLHSGQRLAGPQHRQRALEAAQIKGLFGHRPGDAESQKSWPILIIGAAIVVKQKLEPRHDPES